MDDMTYIAIDKLCEIINGFPSARRNDAIMRTALAIGQSAEPTGLSITADRPIRQAFWDIEIDDLRDRMIALREEHGIDNETIIFGVIGNLDWHFRRHADREWSDGARDSQISLVNKLRADLGRPESEREYKDSDEGIKSFVEKLALEIDKSERKRQDAQEALDYLREETTVFDDWKLWHAFEVQRADPARLREFLDSDEDEAEIG